MTKDEFIQVLEKHAELRNSHTLDFDLAGEKFNDVANELEQLGLFSVSGSFSDKDLLNGYCAGVLETLTNKEPTFLGYDHLNKIKKEAKEWKERYTDDR